MPLLATLGFVGLAAAAPPPASDAVASLENHQQGLYERTAPAVVFISNQVGFGSGFIVREDGLILTNAHVVGKRDEVDVVRLDGTTVKGKVIEKADKLDLALVDIPGNGMPTLPMAADPDAVRVGAWAASVGHGRGGIWTFTTGMVTNRYLDDGVTVFQTQLPVNPGNSGNSGGPIVDRSGTVIGIVTAGMVDAQAINFAIPAFEAVRALDKMDGACQCLTVRAPAGAAVFVDGAMVGTGPTVRVPTTPGEHEVFAIIGGKKVDRTASWPDKPEVELK
jgi:serine protease Do